MRLIMMKKICNCFLILSLISLFSSPVQALQIDIENDDYIQSKLLKVSFFKQATKTEEQQIFDVLNSVSKNLTKRKINKLKQFYDTSFITNDGFNYNFYFEVLNDIWKNYPRLEYQIIPKKVSFSKNYAQVLCEEVINGTVSGSSFFNGEGVIQAKAQTIYYLKKSSINWLVTGINVLDETSTIKFGNAVNLDFELQAPFQVQNDSFYTISLDIKNPQNNIVVASLNSIPIIYPQKNPLDIFKITSSENTLERMVKSNKNGHNENAVATIGIYEKNTNGNAQNKVKSTGAAFVLRRVNVFNLNKNNKLNE